MTTVAARRSPLHDALEHLHPNWAPIHGMPTALHFGDTAQESEQARTLALCDVCALPRIGIKGPGARAVAGLPTEPPIQNVARSGDLPQRAGDRQQRGAYVMTWLLKHGITAPHTVYGHADLSPVDGLIIRTGTSELFIEDGVRGEVVSKLWVDSDSALVDVYRFHRQDAAMLLSGERAVEVLAETCGYNFREPDADLVFSRVAGVSCCILRKDREGMPIFRLWCDGSFGSYLWEQLHEITREHGGRAVGMLAYYSSLL